VLIAEARIETGRPDRYLTQLCNHVSNISGQAGSPGHERGQHAGAGGQRPAAPPHAECSGSRGTITFATCTITLLARPGVLALHAEAGDEQSLQQAQDRVTGLLERIGRRDQLTVCWQRTDMPA
jgi:hypothetical protein